MKNILFGLGSLLGLYASPALAQNSAQDLKNYLSIREQYKSTDLAALKKVAASPGGKNVDRGLAAYYQFLKTPLPDGNPAAGKALVDALETAANAFLDPLSLVKLAQIYARETPDFSIRQDQTKALRYLSMAWEIADLSDRATGDNALLTVIINNTLGIGDGFLADNAQGRFDFKKALEAVRPDVLRTLQRFKKLYNLSIKDEFAGSTNVERHYGS